MSNKIDGHDKELLDIIASKDAEIAQLKAFGIEEATKASISKGEGDRLRAQLSTRSQEVWEEAAKIAEAHAASENAAGARAYEAGRFGVSTCRDAGMEAAIEIAKQLRSRASPDIGGEDRVEPRGEWRDISTAPKDRAARIDLWVEDRKHKQAYRVPDGHYAPCNGKAAWANRDGKWISGACYWDNDEEDYCYDPTRTDDESCVVTHWREPPPPPIPGAAGPSHTPATEKGR